MIATLKSRRFSNIVSGELYPRLRNVGYHRRKKNQLLQFIQKIVVGPSYCRIGCVECHGSKPRTSSSSPPQYGADKANSDSRTCKIVERCR